MGAWTLWTFPWTSVSWRALLPNGYALRCRRPIEQKDHSDEKQAEARNLPRTYGLCEHHARHDHHAHHARGEMHRRHLRARERSIAIPRCRDVEHVLRQHDGPAHCESDPEPEVPNAKMCKPRDRHERS